MGDSKISPANIYSIEYDVSSINYEQFEAGQEEQE